MPWAPSPCFLPSMAPRPLPHHPGALAELGVGKVKATACLSAGVKNSRAEPQARLSEPRPPTKATCCPAPRLPLYWPGAASRAETGRGAADPLGELTCTSLFRAREEKQKGGRVGEGPLPTVCHQRHKSMALCIHDSEDKDTCVCPSGPSRSRLAPHESPRSSGHPSSSTSCFCSAFSGTT